jgi:hypothetical protein
MPVTAIATINARSNPALAKGRAVIDRWRSIWVQSQTRGRVGLPPDRDIVQVSARPAV